jgi:hypothetical protein
MKRLFSLEGEGARHGRIGRIGEIKKPLIF